MSVMVDVSITQATSLQLWQDIQSVLERLPVAVYTQPIPLLYQASIGQHCRHLIEFFQCIEQQWHTGIICYDARRRHLPLEQSPQAACDALDGLRHWLQTAIAPSRWIMYVQLRTHPDPATPTVWEDVASTLIREWWYAIDHAIHHLALFKVGLHLLLPDFELPAHFGVAPATVHYHLQQE